MSDEWRQFDNADLEPLEEEVPSARRRNKPRAGLTNGVSEANEVPEFRALLAEIIHRSVMEAAAKEERTPLLDERVEYEGYGGCLSACRVQVYDPNPIGQTAKRPLIIVFTEQDCNPGTSVTATFAGSHIRSEWCCDGDRSANRIAHLANRMFERLGKPEPVPVFVEHYPNRVHDAVSRPKFDRNERLSDAESFAFVGFMSDVSGVFQSPNWQYTTRQTVEVIIGQPLRD